MFKFGFSGPEDEDQKSEDQTEETLKWAESEEIFVPEFKIPGQDLNLEANIFACGDFEIGYITVNPKALKKDLIFETEAKHSDLIPAKYEGGLKIWECTQDLGEYIDENLCESLQDKLVLDMGCGAGVLGIMALENGAKVHFQDYNKEVIKAFTIPNVNLNCEDDSKDISIKNCRFFCGDWTSFSEKIENIKYDFIFTSETIYNPDNYDKIITFFEKHLEEGGTAYLAAKGYYFGVGGSVNEFEKRIKEQSTNLSCEVVWTHDKGVIRKILEIKLKS